MGRLFEQVRDAVAADRWIVDHHADEMLRQRGIAEWQVLMGVSAGRLIIERPRSMPNPIVEIEQHLASGTPIKAVWAYLPVARVAKLVTVHFFDR